MRDHETNVTHDMTDAERAWLAHLAVLEVKFTELLLTGHTSLPKTAQ